MHHKGETVTIINQNISGASIIEGDALLMKFIDFELHNGVDYKEYFIEKWQVMFDDGRTANRWIYPQCGIDSIK